MKVLLHICCGVCAAGAALTLREEGHEVTGYFYNPNIQPPGEYERRLAAARRVADELSFRLAVPLNETERWVKETALFWEEPEGGSRCSICFRIRLKETFRALPSSGADVFTTTLTISPVKSAGIVNTIGTEIGGDKYLVRDFKKKDGFRKAVQLARQWQLYRQDYCGCTRSIRPAG